MKTITDAALRPEANNLSFVRLCLASSVIYSHCKWLVTGDDADIFSALIGEPVSGIAVDGFFFLSGFLVYRSLARKGDAADFLRARLVRLWPGLAASVAVLTLIGLALGGRFGNDTAQFIVRNLLLQGGGYSITGLGVVNGSLWSITWEVQCYVMLAVLAVFGFASPHWMTRIVFPAALAFALLYHLLPASGSQTGIHFYLGRIDRLLPMFLLGCAAMIWRGRLVLDWRIAAGLALLAVLAHRTGLHTHLESVATGYAILWAGFAGPAFSGRWPDFSYGMYIYAFPVMIALGAVHPFSSVWTLSLANALVTFPIAGLSWTFVERPMLENARMPLSRTTKVFDRAARIILFVPGTLARGAAQLRSAASSARSA